MYYPFFRGKQFELVLLREWALQIARWDFVPIIEPVKENFPALKRALDELTKNNCHFILIANPSVGELKENNCSLWEDIFDTHLQSYGNYAVGLNLTANDSLKTAEDFFKSHKNLIAIIHNGFSNGKGLSALIGEKKPSLTEHVFVEQHSSTLYRRHFKNDAKRVIVGDEFKIRNNRDYPPSEPFSELYLIFKEMGCDAFGDFLMVGSDFKDGGGPAYAIAIHITFVDPTADNALAIKHYVSDKVDTPKDPAGKFLEALSKLAADVQKKNSPIFKTKAIEEYLQLFEDRHFPGLGYVKKLSMQHHVELMAHLLD